MAKTPEPKASKLEILVPKKAKSPAINPVKNRTVKVAPKSDVTLTNVPEINSIYSSFKTRLPSKVKHGMNIGKIENAKRKSDLIRELVYAINDGPYDLGLSSEEWIALTTRAYYKYMDEYGPIVEVSPTVIDGVKVLIESMSQDKSNYILPEENDADKIVRFLDELKRYGVEAEDVGETVNVILMEEALYHLESSIENFKASPFPLGSPKFSRQGTHVLATRAFMELGFNEKDAREKANLLFAKM